MVSLICDFSGSSRLSWFEQRLGVDADLAVDDELQPRQADPGVGQLRERERLLGGPDVHHDLGGDLRHRRHLGLLDGELQLPVVDVAGVTLGARDRDPAAVSEFAGRVAGADDGRDPELARNDRGVAGATAAVGDDGRRALHDRLPVGVGHVGDEDLALVELVHVLDRGHHPNGAGADLLADGAALDDDLAALAHPVALPDPGARHHRLGTCLEDVDFPVETVLAPLDVHRPLVVVLDGQRVPGQLLDLGVGEAEQPTLVLLGVDELGRLADRRILRVDHFDRLRADPALEHRRPTGTQRWLVDVVLVRVHRALHDRLAQPVRRGHEHGVVEPGLGVHREHHPGRADVRTHHLLHTGRERNSVVVEVVVHPVGDGAVVVERGEHLTDRLQHAVDALDVQEGLLLAREGSIRQVLRGRAGAYGEGHLVAPVDQSLERVPDVTLEVLREGLVGHLLADRLDPPRRAAACRRCRDP